MILSISTLSWPPICLFPSTLASLHCSAGYSARLAGTFAMMHLIVSSFTGSYFRHLRHLALPFSSCEADRTLQLAFKGGAVA